MPGAPGKGEKWARTEGRRSSTPPRGPQSVRSVLGGEVWTVWTPTSSVLPKGGLEAGGSNSGSD